MLGTDSLSKGVFSFKKQKSSPTKSPRKKVKSAPAEASLPFLYHDIISISSFILQSVQKSSFENVLKEVIQYLSRPILKGNVLDTGVIITGVNLPDHADLFSLLVQEIRNKRTKHVSLLKSASVTTLKALIGSIVRQLINTNNSQEDAKNHGPEVEEYKRRDLLLPVFRDWYQKQYSVQEDRPPCVIILEDFESFNDTIVQEMLYNIREFCGDVPFVLLLGVATSVDSIHRSLPTDLTSNLMIRKFSSQSSSQTFAEVVEKVIISNKDIPFKLGNKVFKLLFDIFLFHDFSIKNFLSGYKFCLLEHMSSPIGKLLTRSVSQLSHDELETYRRCYSFRNYVEEDVHCRAILLIDDKKFKICLEKCLKELESSTNKFNLAVSVIYTIVTSLQRNPIGKYLHTIYLSALSEEFVHTPEYKEMFQLLKLTEKTDLVTIVNKIIDHVKDNPNTDEFISELKSYLVRLNDVNINHVPSNIVPETLPEKKEQPTEFKTRLSRTQWQEALKENMLKEKRKIVSVYEGIRSEILSGLHKYFVDALKLPTSLPFHEVKFFNNSASVKRHLIGDHRISIQTALAYPGDYLDNVDLAKVQKYEIPPILPDISVAFKLYSECGKLINLYDWLQCWLSVIKGDNDKEEEDDELLQARFSQAVAELQFLGFIKSSKRKTDHVSRLTWGGY